MSGTYYNKNVPSETKDKSRTPIIGKKYKGFNFKHKLTSANHNGRITNREHTYTHISVLVFG